MKTKNKPYIEKITSTVLLSLLLILVASCNKKEAPTAPTGLTAVAYDDHIRLSWNRVSNADYYSITVDFQMKSIYNELCEETYNIFLGEASNTNYIDLYPFEGMNYYKIQAVNEYGFSSYSEISCYYSESNPTYFLYPNPANNRVTLSPSDAINHDITKHIIVENTQSDAVCDCYFLGTIEINTSLYESGIYLARIITENDEVVKRFVVAHE